MTKKSSFLGPIEEFIGGHLIDLQNAIEEIHPRKFSPEFVDSSVGEVNCDISKYLTLSIGEPNYDLLDRSRSSIRPALLLLTGAALGLDPKELIPYAAMGEIFHNGTLIHDDIEDNALSRRNREPVHELYGLDVAVNSANFMYFSPLHAIKEMEIEDEKKIKLYEWTVRNMINVTFGQACDIYWHKHGIKISEEEYLQMASYKTGGVDRFSLTLAGIAAGVDEEKMGHINVFGQKVGAAFQTHDDVLDIVALDRAGFGGKPIGNDVSEGKRSIVTVNALNLLSEQEVLELEEILGIKTFDQELIKRAVNLMYSCGSIERSVETAERLFGRLSKDTPKLSPREPYSCLLSSFWEHMANDVRTKYAAFVDYMEK